MFEIAMGTQYTHLELEERCRLRGLMEMRLGIGEIARRLGRHRTTIHWEISRKRCVGAIEWKGESIKRCARMPKLRKSPQFRTIVQALEII